MQNVARLHDRLLLDLREAAGRLAAHDGDGAVHAIDSASAVLLDLIRTLDFGAVDDLVARLAALYAYFLRALSAIGVSLDPAELDRVIELVTALCEGWDEAESIDAGRERGADR